MVESGQHHEPTVSPTGKEPRYSLNRRVNGLERWPGRFGEEEMFFVLAGIRIP